MDLITILFVTAAVLGLLLVVLAVIGVVVLLPPVRRALADRSRGADESDPDVDAAVADSQSPNSDGPEPAQR